MRLSLWKKAAVLGMAFTMTMSLTACGGIKGNKSNAKSTKISVDAKEVVYKGEDIDTSSVKGEVGLNSFVRIDDKIYFFTIENLDEGTSEGEDSGNTLVRAHKIYSINVDGTGLTQICEPEIISEEAVDYFNGHKSVDETAAIVQERVNKYVNEFR